MTSKKAAILISCGALWVAMSLAFQVTPADARAYFIDADNGDDRNDALNAGSAWKTFKPLKRSRFAPGDQILLKRGCQWNASLLFIGSGTPDLPIRIAAYGNGPPPLLTNSMPVKHGCGEGAAARCTAVPEKWCYGVFIDGEKAREATDIGLSDGDWHFEKKSGTLFFRKKQANQSVSYANKSSILEIRDSKHVVVEGLSFRFAASAIVIGRGASHVTVENCHIERCYERGVGIRFSEGYCTIRNNVIDDVGDGIYLMDRPGDNHRILANRITRCNYDQVNNNDGHGIGLQNTSNNLIQDNELAFCVDAIAVWSAAGHVSANNRILNSRIQDCKKRFKTPFRGKGITIGTQDARGARGNVAAFNIIERCNFGIKVSVAKDRNCISNNLVYRCGQGMVLSRGADHTTILNNIFLENDAAHISDEHAHNGENNRSDYNCFFPDGPGRFQFRGRKIEDLSHWKRVSTHDTHSIAANPLLQTQASRVVGLAPSSVCRIKGMVMTDPAACVSLDLDRAETGAPMGPF